MKSQLNDTFISSGCLTGTLRSGKIMIVEAGDADTAPDGSSVAISVGENGIFRVVRVIVPVFFEDAFRYTDDIVDTILFGEFAEPIDRVDTKHTETMYFDRIDCVFPVLGKVNGNHVALHDYPGFSLCVPVNPVENGKMIEIRGSVDKSWDVRTDAALHGNVCRRVKHLAVRNCFRFTGPGVDIVFSVCRKKCGLNRFAGGFCEALVNVLPDSSVAITSGDSNVAIRALPAKWFVPGPEETE